MSLFSGDNEIGNILQEAVKLKSAQMGQKRKTYETWPYFVQHTLFHGEKEEFKAGRQLPFQEKMVICERLKEEGNKLYQEMKYSDAVDKYEEAPTLFHYCYSTDPGWRKNNRGIDDDVIVLVAEEGANEAEAVAIRKFRLSCCLNIAACKIKLVKYDEAVVACNTALELDPENIKALYRRAEARVKPSGSTAYDHDCAIKDLAKAQSLDPDDKTVSKLLTHLRGERRVQRDKDKVTFTGMFNRGEIYDEESMEKAEAPKPVTSHRWEGVPNDSEVRDLRSRIENVSDDDPLEKRIADAELLRDLYQRNGKEDEAQKLNEQIQGAKRSLEQQKHGPSGSRTGMDFSNPTPEMIADAEKYGLDLNDPLVQAELQRIEREGPGALEGMDDDSGPPLPPSPREAQPPPPPAPTVPDDVEHVKVPWKRYLWFFGAIGFALRSRDAVVVLQQTTLWMSNVWARLAEDPAASGEIGDSPRSFFARAYRVLFGGEEPDF